MPPKHARGGVDYAGVDYDRNYWGDTAGVFRKPEHYSLLIRPVREVIIWWANRVNGIDHVPRKYGTKERFHVAL